MIGVLVNTDKPEVYVSHNGDQIAYGDRGELIIKEIIPRKGAEPASSRVMALFAPGHWVAAKQLA